MLNKYKISALFLLIFLLVQISCSSKKTIRSIKTPIAKKSNIAVIIDSSNNIKNVVMTKFMSNGFNVKAINVSDLYDRNDIFDIKDFKEMAKKSPGKKENNLLSIEKTYENVSKLHIYNFEANKAEYLNKIRDTWKVRYLVLLDLKDWENVSWGRVIDLKNYEVIWIENYPTKYSDNIESIVDHFIKSMTKR